MVRTPGVYISYSEKDRDWRDRLVQHLRAFQRQGLVELIDSTRIPAGSDMVSETVALVERADVAVLLISVHYLASDRIRDTELVRLLARHENEGLRLVPVLVGPCDWTTESWLVALQMIPRDNVPLATQRPEAVDTHLAEVAQEVRAQFVKLVKAEERREVLARVEGTAAEYISSSLDELRARERADRRWALLWYAIGYASLIVGVVVAGWRVYRLGSLPSGWAALVEFSIMGIVAIALLLALARYAFVLGKSFMVEALRHADRIHAISFGHFYLKAFGAHADWNNVKDALQHWNIDRGSSFASQESASFDPKLLEAATEIAKVLADKSRSK